MRSEVAFAVAAGLAILGAGIRDAIVNPVSPAGSRLMGVARDPVVAETFRDVSSSDPLPQLVNAAILPEFVHDFSHGDLAEFHPHGDQICASGCAASRHPTERLTTDRFQQLLADYAVEPSGESGDALDSLLYYGRQVSGLLQQMGTGPLDPEQAARLKQELARGHAEVSLRLVDDSGVVRASLPPTRVPLDRRHEFKLAPHDLQPLIASGTVKRVGRDYLWTRL